MGKLSLTLIVVGTAACGSNNNNTVDAHIVVQVDAKPIDAPKVFNDAPPVNLNFGCFGTAAPLTAADPITIKGETQSLQGQALGPLAAVTVESYKTGTATALDTKVSAADGTFTTGNLATGAVPLDGYLKATIATYRTSYLYPPNVITANLPNAPVLMLSTAQFAMLGMLGINQDDVNNGFMLITVADCSLTPISGAVLTVKQGGNEVGTQVDLGQVLAAFAGVYAVANVPDGDVTIGGSYNAMTFPGRVVHAYKKPQGVDAVGTVTVSAVVPGWF